MKHTSLGPSKALSRPRRSATLSVALLLMFVGLFGCRSADVSRGPFDHGQAAPFHSAAGPALAVHAPRNMVVAAEPLAALAGVTMLEQGGNAVDAAVAVGFALAVTYPVAGNLGGGGFMVATLPGEPVSPIALDFRETAPSAAHRDLYKRAAEDGRVDASTLGPLAAGVPGSVAGMLHALEHWGTLDRATVLAPSIELALSGFEVSKRTHGFLVSSSIAEKMKRFSATAALFYPDGQPLPVGARLVQPELAATLQRIAKDGVDGFYDGPVAQAIVAEMERSGGIMTSEDLRSYRVVVRKPLVIAHRGLQVVTMPPPSSGGVCVAQILKLLERWSWADLPAQSAGSLHLLAEAMRRSFADRNEYLGDPDHSMPSGDPDHSALLVQSLLADRRIRQMAADIDRSRATPSAALFPRPEPGKESEETTHYSVVDRWGNAVAVTTTLNGAFGSKTLVPGAGFLLNNEMDDFATRPGEPNLYGLVQGERNAVGPGRRPLSSMTPTVVLDDKGQVRYVLGSPGGPTILTNVLQVLIYMTVHDMAPNEAVAAAKIHHQTWPDRISTERGMPGAVRSNLEGLGHQVVERGAIGDFQLIAIDPETQIRIGVTDPRGGGAAYGN